MPSKLTCLLFWWTNEGKSQLFWSSWNILNTHMVYNWILVEMLTWKITHSIIKPPKVVCQLKKSHIQLFWLITKHSDAWQITHGWMTLRLGLMSLLQVHGMIIFQLQLQVERQKMNVGHSYILCQHLNCKCYFVNITTTIVPCSTNIGMHGSSFF